METKQGSPCFADGFEDHAACSVAISLSISQLYLSVLIYVWGAMYEHLRVVPPGKRFRVPPRIRCSEILGSG